MTDLREQLETLAELRAKSERLEARRIAEEIELLQQLRADYDARLITDLELQDTYLEVRAVSAPGFFGRWNSVMPVRVSGVATRVAHRKRQLARAVPNGPGGLYWFGTFPISPADPTPIEGMPVVYVLYDGLNQPLYVGSTKNFLVRMGAHLRDGKHAERWMAYPCKSRTAAYELEEKLLAEHQPPLNRKATR